jgi:hypothetical protein
MKNVSVILIVLAAAALACTPATAQNYTGHQIALSPAQQSQLSTYPNYPYDPDMDPNRSHAAAPGSDTTSPEQRAKDLATQSGFDLGLQISDYNYEEPSLNVKLTGPKFGVNALLTGKFGEAWFVTGDVRGAFGTSDYTGTGTQNGNFEDLWDLRALAGRDFFASTFSLSPYLGIGYRNFYSDDRGTTSVGAQGYRRENELFYIPLGIEPRFRVMEDARIATDIEYDYVISGTQTSTLSDANVGFPDVTNHQKSGYGVRGSVMWETKRWAAGPFFNYWNIDQSNTTCATGPTFGLCGYEPTNHTFEAGAQVRYHFF